MLALAICFLVLFTIKVDDALEEYENARPINAANTLLNELKNGNYTAINLAIDDDCFGKPSEPEAEAYISKCVEDGVELAEIGRNGENEYKYRLNFSCGKSIEITVGKIGKTTHGFTQWGIINVTNLPVDVNMIQLLADETSAVYVDGQKLTSEYITESGISTTLISYFPENAYNFDRCEYEIKYCICEPEITVFDKNGREQSIERDNNVFFTKTNYDENLSVYEEDCLSVFKKLNDYIIGTGDIYKVYGVIKEGSLAYDTVYEYSKWNSAKAGTSMYEWITCTDYLYLSDECFCCRVSASMICSYLKKDDTVYNPNYEMYFQICEDGIKLINFISI